MALITTAELVAQIEDTDGVEVVYEGETTWGHLEAPGEVVLAEDGRAGVVATDRSVAVATGALSEPLEAGAPIKVDGSYYVIHRTIPFGDGVLTRIWLQED